MNAWIIIGLAVLAILALMIVIGRLPRPTWEVTAAALVLGLTGYALQGQPALDGAPAKPVPAQKAVGEELISIRADMERSFSVSKQWTITSDAFARSGKYSLAMAYVQSGLKKHPQSADLWSALGLYAMLASDGQMSQPAQFAFSRARKFNAKHPAPDYFEGLSAFFEGRVAETLEKWTNARDNAPKNAKWKPKLEAQLRALTAAAQRALKDPQSKPISGGDN